MCDNAGAESIALPEPAQNQAADEGIGRLHDIEMECGEQHCLDEVRGPERKSAPLQRRQRHAAEAQLLGKRVDDGEPKQVGERDGGCCRGIDLGEQLDGADRDGLQQDSRADGGKHSGYPQKKPELTSRADVKCRIHSLIKGAGSQMNEKE